VLQDESIKPINFHDLDVLYILCVISVKQRKDGKPLVS